MWRYWDTIQWAPASCPLSVVQPMTVRWCVNDHPMTVGSLANHSVFHQTGWRVDWTAPVNHDLNSLASRVSCRRAFPPNPGSTSTPIPARLVLPVSGHNVTQTIKSPYPALNVWRRNEPVASDTIFAETPAIDTNGHTMAQIFIGRKSLVIDVFGMRSCLLYTSPSPRDLSTSRMPSSA